MIRAVDEKVATRIVAGHVRLFEAWNDTGGTESILIDRDASGAGLGRNDVCHAEISGGPLLRTTDRVLARIAQHGNWTRAAVRIFEEIRIRGIRDPNVVRLVD